MLSLDATANGIAAEYAGEPRGSHFEAWREEIWRRFGRVDSEPASKDAFSCRIDFSRVGGLTLATALGNSACYSRSRRLTADQCDDFMLFLPHFVLVDITHRGRQVDLQSSEMLIGEMCSEIEVRAGEHTRFSTLRIPRRELLGVCPGVEDRQVVRLDGNPAIRKAITGYLALLGDVGGTLHPTAQLRLAQHTVDMVALLLIDSAGSLERGAGDPSTARLQLIQCCILEHIVDPDLSIGTVAGRLGYHPKQVQRLFATTGRTFSEFVLDERLQLARRRLQRFGFAEKISSIAFDLGFGDLAYFNRTFRARFGMTPSECREKAAAAT